MTSQSKCGNNEFVRKDSMKMVFANRNCNIFN